MEKDLRKIPWLTYVFVFDLFFVFTNGAIVRDVQPKTGSLNGETRLTISGSGFSADQFSQNDDPNKGNKVYLVGESGREFRCPVHLDGSTEIQIMCYTPEKMSEEKYYVKVVVDGKVVPDSNLCGGEPKSDACTYTPQTRNTPSIKILSPQSGNPGSKVTMSGKLMSDRYGSNLPASTNGKLQKVLRVYLGPQDCLLKNGDNFYRLSLDNEETDDGVLGCKTQGSSVGFYNASFIIESPYGRSKPDPEVYRVSYNDEIYMYQMYTNITSISPSSGSTAGGLTLTIFGNYFDDRRPYTAPRAYIGDTICRVTKVVLDQYLECQVAQDPSYSATKFRGNRGVNFEYWTSTTKTESNVNDVLTLTSNSPGYNRDDLDETYHMDINNTMDNYVSRMTTIFSPPHTGEYQFQLQADDGAKLFVDGVETLTATTSWANSSRMNLNRNNQYLLEIVHYESTGDAFVHLRAKFFNTTFTSAWTGKAKQERQVIKVNSRATFDVQVLAFGGFASGTPTKEVQTVTISQAGQFRFGLYGVYTVGLTTDMDEVTISNAVNALPIFGQDESVMMTRNPSSPPSFTFTFESKRGDFPDIEVIKVVNSSDVVHTVVEDYQGVPDKDTASLLLEGHVSQPFTVSTLTESTGQVENFCISTLHIVLQDYQGAPFKAPIQLEGHVSQPFTVSTLTESTLGSIINGMFESRCPAVFESKSKAKVYENYERAGEFFSGQIVTDTEPFCGRSSVKNPWKIYQKRHDELGIPLFTNGKVCFAYKGLLRNLLGVRVSMIDGNTMERVNRTAYYTVTFNKDSATKSDTWYYNCTDVYRLVYGDYQSDTDHRLDEIYVYRENVASDIYIDSLFIGNDVTIQDPEINLLRQRPAMANKALMKSATVSNTGPNTYSVTLEPFDCGNQFDLFELGNGQTSAGAVTSPSNSARLVLRNGASSSLSVTRTSSASPPVSGFIDISFNGTTRSNLNVSRTGPEFQRELESLAGIGSLSVEKVGDCANFDLVTTFLTLPGDLPEMSVSYNNLVGVDASSRIDPQIDGGLLYDPLTGDMAATVHDKAQVRVYINNVPVACTGDCSFEWSSTQTPTVTSVSPSSGTLALSTVATISGTGFNTTLGGNSVMIGGVACNVTAATATSLSCEVGNGPVGEHKVRVTVNDKGEADHGGTDVMFSYVANISSITPTVGSLGGGIILTISGYGFKSGAVVTINSRSCHVTRITSDTIQCIVPPMSADGTHDVMVVQGSTTLVYSSYTYDSSLTASVNSITPNIIGVLGGTLTISGTAFGALGTVKLGNDALTITSWSDTQIVVEVGSVDPGVKEVKIESANGFALDGSNAIPTIDVQLMITNVYPLQGSLQGGTRLTITGTGFGTNLSSVDVDIGSFDCGVSSVTNTQIICQIQNAGRVHEVTNLGVDPAFGVYYAFDRPVITVNKGDFIQWRWQTPDFVNDINHAVIEVDSPSSTTAKVGGFTSGTPSKNGQFRYQFAQTGTFYVWSGYVDTYGIKNYAGTIHVVEANSSIGQVSVKVANKVALHELGGADPVDSSVCQSVISAKTGCSDSLPTGGDPTKFNFAFWTCSTPIVTAIDRRNGTVQSTVTITGEGFSTQDCQNEVNIAGFNCVTSGSTETSFTCQMEKVGRPQLGVLHPFSVRVGNRGNALLNILALEDKSFGLLPNIESITPLAGSMAGGATMTITGFGFGDAPLVNIDGNPCNIINSSYTEIVCETPSSTGQNSLEITVTAYVNGSPLPAKCETTSRTCRYTYARLWTPSISTIDPTSMSGSTTFTMTGTGFGTSKSEVDVTIGGVQATVDSVTPLRLVGNIANVPVGNNDVVVKVKDFGKASGSLTVVGGAGISTISPSSGSIHGRTVITISGNGFVENKTAVTLDGNACTLQSVTISQIMCQTAAHTVGSVDLIVTSNSVTYPTETFTYRALSTPTVSSVSPTSGLSGDSITITGLNLDGTAVTVSLDSVPCTITSSSRTRIVCTLGEHATGSVPIEVYVSDKGVSNTDVNFEYQLSLASVNPSSGGTAGGQTITLVGTGFDASATVTVCSTACQYINSTATEYKCKTPANSAQTCDVVISLNGLTQTRSNAYTYDASVTPTLSGVTPKRGGTGGGTVLTITGTGFGTDLNNVKVKIDGADCVPSNVVNTQIVCATGAHPGSKDTKVEVEISGNGIAQEAFLGDADFQYIDVWSSVYTWGGGPLPQEGDFIIIPAGMTLILDTNTPRLDFLLIQGGKLIFDDKDVELQSNIIMITDGGLLQIGTEAQPFQHKGIITLHGHHRSKELPIYGTKVLAVRNGTLDLHGIEVPVTWTRLASTATQGSNTLVLQHPVEWKVGDEIVIAATGHHHSQSENEKKIISAISADKMTLTLTTNLEADHVGVTETFDGRELEFRAEVGLLTHNVVVRGNSNPQWADEIQACEKGFDTGEFATQTCFLGRFGDEIGSSQFGAMILIHAPVKDLQAAVARISYTEVTFAGQAFRLGRYPIHFHLNGDMLGSYVRGCGIHHTFNRAVNIHGTQNAVVEKTVIYNIMGGAFFLEDGIETGNTFQYNLAVFVRESSSLLNDDVTPASFWLTNPNNTVQHNAAAGGSHFGFWYRMHQFPDGPSFTTSVCPQNVPLGVFYNNSAHSFGWFGLWIFEDYFPLKGSCGGTEVEPAVFQNLYAWNNDKGAEAVNSGALQFDNFVLVQNKLAGYEGKKVLNVPQYTDASPMIKNSLIVGRTTVIPNSMGCQRGGLVFPYGSGFRVINVTFVNHDSAECSVYRWCRISGTCSIFCGGYNYHAEGIRYVSSPNKATYEWDWEGVIVDKDGTATGKGQADWTIVPTTGTLPSDCEAAPEFSQGVPASFCPPPHKFHRFAFNNPLPASLEGKNFLITNQYGTSSVPYAKKRLSHKPGWMCALVDGATYSFEFENADQITNISFSGQFYEFAANDYLYLKYKVKEFPDRVSIDGGNSFINATVGTINPATAKDGDWEWDNVNKVIKFIVHGNKRSKRGMSTYSVDRPYGFTSYKCFYTDCIPPPDPDTVPPATQRPLDFKYWHDMSIWNKTDNSNSTTDVFVSNEGGSYGLPQDYDNVRIIKDDWVVVNGSISKLGILLLEGVLEFADHTLADYTIEADFIIIKGGRLIIGWPDDPFDGVASIILRGNHSSTYYIPGDGPTLGSKAIGVFGGLDLHGQDVGLTWTQLGTTAIAGSNQIVLSEPVGWLVGDDIVVGPTSFNPWETESFKITAVSADNLTLTLNETLKYRHIAHRETLSNGDVIDVGAGVGRLTRNIKIIGQDYSGLYTESFGARVLVGLVVSRGQTYTGYGRISNVEFYHTGQEGFTEEYDPRFSLSYVATGTVSNVKPSSVTKCSFHNGFNTAIGAFGTGSLNITDNVVFGSVGNGLATSSNDTRLRHNLVALMVATNSYQDRVETFNPRWEAGIEAMKATELKLQDNLVSGSERIGYHVAPLNCDDTTDNYRNNRAFANVVGGVVIIPTDVLTQTTCAKLSSFICWKNHDYGLYYQNEPSAILSNNMLIENTNGIMSIVYKPSAVGHEFANKTVDIMNSTFVGMTSSFDCSGDVKPSVDDNYDLSKNSRPSSAPSGGMAGLVFPNFYEKSNNAPGKPWKGCMAYNAIGGLMRVTDVTFAKYGSTCKGDFAVATNIGNDDLQHPVESQRVTLIDVESTNKIVYHRPNVHKINSADCVDMDCDALKKALFKDLDGSFLGHVGNVVPESEFEWDTNPRRGLGDYRIPKEMLTDMNGNRLDVNIVAPHKGVIRNSNCTLRSSWQAYECGADIDHEMLIIESMDADTETRRLSPVAVLGDGYLDLINGPQDHGWCSGYTCRKRLSTFMALVSPGKEFLIHFTSPTPKHLRLRLLNVKPDVSVKLTVWYAQPNRLDVFVDDTYVMASNGRKDSNGRYILTMPKQDEFMPQVSNATGTNFFDKDVGKLSFIIRGQHKLDIVTKETVIVSFGIPSLTVTDFFGDNMVENIAGFLNIPLTKIRVVNVVSAPGTGRRKKRSTGIMVELEIGDEPTDSINQTANNTLDYSALTGLAASIVNECQVGDVSSSFNMSGSCQSVSISSTDTSVGSITYNTPSPDHLFFHTSLISGTEGSAFPTQPRIQVADSSNNVITELGTAESPWILTVSIRSGTGHPNAVLEGTTQVNSSSGWFNFTDLSISHMGTDYILDFNVTSPSQATNFSLSSAAFNMSGRQLSVGIASISSGDIVKDVRFQVALDLRDSVTNQVVSNITWRDHVWSAEATMLGSSKYGNLSGTLTSTFDMSNGQALFPDLTLTGVGMYYIKFSVTSNPPDYNLTTNYKVNVISPSHVGLTIEETYEVKLKFDVDFHTVLNSTDSQNEFEQMILSEMANTWTDVKLSIGSITEGSIVVTFVISGTLTSVNSTAYSLCDSVVNGTAYQYNGYTLTLSPFMTINNQTYYGVTCAINTNDGDDGETLAPYLIAIIVILAILVMVAIVIFISWRINVGPKVKTHAAHQGTHYYGNRNVEDILFREDTFTSLKFRPEATGAAPVSTNIGIPFNKVQQDEYLSGFKDLKRGGPAILVSARTPRPTNIQVSQLMQANMEQPPPYTDQTRLCTPGNTSQGRATPTIQRAHTPFRECDSPLPPVGRNTFE